MCNFARLVTQESVENEEFSSYFFEERLDSHISIVDVTSEKKLHGGVICSSWFRGLLLNVGVDNKKLFGVIVISFSNKEFLVSNISLDSATGSGEIANFLYDKLLEVLSNLNTLEELNKIYIRLQKER